MTLRLTYLHVNLHIYNPAARQAKIEAAMSFFVLKGATCPSKIIGLSPFSMSEFALFSQLAFLVAC